MTLIQFLGLGAGAFLLWRFILGFLKWYKKPVEDPRGRVVIERTYVHSHNHTGNRSHTLISSRSPVGDDGSGPLLLATLASALLPEADAKGHHHGHADDVHCIDGGVNPQASDPPDVCDDNVSDYSGGNDSGGSDSGGDGGGGE